MRAFRVLRQLLRQITLVILPTGILYLVLLAASYILFPKSPEGALDPVLARETFLRTPPTYLTYGSSVIARDDRINVLLGPSNVSLGFRPHVLNSIFKNAVFHNMSLGGTSIDGIAAMVDLVFAIRYPREGTGVKFIVGLWYGEFLHNENSRERTPIAQQMSRFGLFERLEDGYRPTVPLEMFDLMVEALRPYFLIRWLVAKNGPFFGGEDPTLLKTRGLQELTCTQQQKSAFRKSPKNPFAEYGTAQFDALAELAAQVSQKGGKLILVDLPHPRCMTKVDNAWQQYQKIKQPLIAKAVSKGALYWNMQDIDGDHLFMDGTHPNTIGAIAHEKRLIQRLRDYSEQISPKSR